MSRYFATFLHCHCFTLLNQELQCGGSPVCDYLRKIKGAVLCSYAFKFKVIIKGVQSQEKQ